MTNALVQYAACVLAVLLLSSCGKESEPAVGSAVATGPATADAQAAPPTEISPEHAAALKDYIARSGGHCTDIVVIQGEDLSNKVKVTCKGQAGDPGTVSYTVDLETEQAQKDG